MLHQSIDFVGFCPVQNPAEDWNAVCSCLRIVDGRLGIGHGRGRGKRAGEIHQQDRWGGFDTCIILSVECRYHLHTLNGFAYFLIAECFSTKIRLLLFFLGQLFQPSKGPKLHVAYFERASNNLLNQPGQTLGAPLLDLLAVKPSKTSCREAILEPWLIPSD